MVSWLWWLCCAEAFAEPKSNEPGAAAPTRRIRIMSRLPALFVACWAVSLVVHVLLWGKPLG